MKKNITLKATVIGLICVSSLLNAQTYTTVNTFAGSTSGLFDGPLASAKFNQPYGMCTDISTGAIYVADTYNHAIRKIYNGNVTTLAGNGIAGDVDGQGSNARFNFPAGICFYNGNVYVADNVNNKIKMIDSNGNVTTIAGSGTAGFLNGAALQAKFNQPKTIDVDANGNFYIADYENHCIRMLSNGQVTTFAGIGGVSGDVLGPVATAKFYRPRDVEVAPNGDIYVADLMNNKIKKISGGAVSLVAGAGTTGSADGPAATATFNHPVGVEIDAFGNLVIADPLNNKIRLISNSGIVSTLAGTGTAGFSNGPIATATFNDLQGVEVDPSGNVYVADRSNNVIRNFNTADVGISSLSDELYISIFPVPAAENITVSNLGKIHLSTLAIYDAEGRLCKTIAVGDQDETVTISIADLAHGEYIIIGQNAATTIKSRFIKE